MLAQAVVTRGLGIVSTALLARLLSPSEWGSVQAVVQTAGTIAQTLKLSIDAGLQIRLSETQREPGDPTVEELLGSGMALLTIVSLVVLVMGLVLKESTAKLFGEAGLVPYMGWAGWLAASQLIVQIGGVLVAFGEVRRLALAYVGMNSAYLAVIVIAYAANIRGLLLGLSAQLFLQLGLALALLALVIHALRARATVPSLSRFWTTQGALLQIGLPVHSAAAVPALVSLFVSANLSRTSGISGLAELRVVGTMNQVVSILPGSMAVAFLTEFASSRGSAKQVSHRDLLRYIRLILANALIVATTVACTAGWVVPLAFGSTYVPVVKLTSLGVATTLICVVKQAMLTGLMSERKTGYALADALISSIMFALLAAWLQPGFGIAGMLISELIGHLIALVFLAWLLSSRFVHPDTAVPALKAASVLALTLIALVISFSTHDRAWDPLFSIPILIALTASVPWVLFTHEERSIVAQLLRARWRRTSP